LTSRQSTGAEINTPLDDESATHERAKDNLSAKPLLLHSLDLHNDAVLDDHADFTVSDALDGFPNMIQVEVAGWWRVGDSSVI
jgi:hypothetical protein